MTSLLVDFQEQPLSASFEKIVHFLGWYDHWVDVNGNIPIERDQYGHHAVQSIVWSMAGEWPTE
jgi:anaphase-promoting complex subunit 5